MDSRTEGLLRIHSFYGELENDLINLFFLNNTNLLRYFCRYIEKDLVTRLKVMKPYLSPPEIQNKAKGIIRSIKPIETSTTNFLFSIAKRETISRRQWEVIYWYLMGKTSEETATILGIKYATVETHFLRIKQKLGCNSKQQILSEIFSHSDFWHELERI